MRKTLSFASIHFTIAFLLGYLFTGSLWVGGALAIIEPLCNTFAFHLHEKLWQKLSPQRAAKTSEQDLQPYHL